MKYFLLLLTLITFTKINIFSKIVDININEETDIDFDGGTLYIRTDLSSSSGGTIIVEMETEENETPSFNYKLVESKDVNVETITYDEIEYLKTTPRITVALFRVLYFFNDSDKYGVLKITGLTGDAEPSVKITYKTNSDIAVIVIVIVAVAILLGIVICWICKKFIRC